MVKIRCKLSYHRTKNSEFKVFATGVSNGVFNNNPPFTPPPPSTQAALQLLIDSFSLKYTNYKLHTVSKGDVDEAKALLMTSLDDFRIYVDGVADGDAVKITLGGFEPTKGSNSNVNPPVQPTGVTLVRGIQGELVAECNTIANADSYGAILLANNALPENIVINGFGQIVVENNNPSPMPGPTPGPMPGPGNIAFIQDLTKGRRKKFSNLQVGVTYYVYFWAMNAGGVSPFSVGVSRKVIEA